MTKKLSGWDRFVKALYDYRAWWVDIPTGTLLFLYHWHFYSLGVHPVFPAFPRFCEAILGIYWLVKERVRRKRLGIQSRRGIIMVAVWFLTLMEFVVAHAINPQKYATLPPGLIEMTLVVILGFTGVVVLKKRFIQKFPQMGDLLETTEPKG